MTNRILLLSAFLAVSSAHAAGKDSRLDDFELQKPATIMEAPPPADNAAAGDQAARIEHGRYMVEILGCGTCHTDGALVGTPDLSKLLAGSRTGIAYDNPLQTARPGVVYPPNLTPDPATGIGRWSEDAVMQFIRTGMDLNGRQHHSVMPWPAYAKLTEADARAIAAYLLALPPVKHRVPKNVHPGQRASAPYVHFGVYTSKKQ